MTDTFSHYILGVFVLVFLSPFKLFYNSDGVNGLFFPVNIGGTLLTTLKMGKINN